MDTIFKADIFFFITTIAVVVGSIVFIVAFIFLIQILNDIRYITRRVRKETDGILDDVSDARKFVKKEAKRAVDIKEIIGGITQLVLNRSKKRSPRKKKE